MIRVQNFGHITQIARYASKEHPAELMFVREEEMPELMEKLAASRTQLRGMRRPDDAQ